MTDVDLIELIPKTFYTRSLYPVPDKSEQVDVLMQWYVNPQIERLRIK